MHFKPRKKFARVRLLALVMFAIFLSPVAGRSQLFKKLKDQVLTIGNQRAVDKASTTTNKTIDQADNLVTKEVNEIINPTKKEKKPKREKNPADTAAPKNGQQN